MESEIFTQMESHFRFLADDYSFSIVQERASAGFGDALLVFGAARHPFLVRVIRDRGCIYVEIGPRTASADPSLWFDLMLVVDFVAPETDMGRRTYASPPSHLDFSFASDWQLAKVAETLRLYWDDISHLFQDDVFSQRRKEMEEFKKKRSDEMLKEISDRYR